MGQSDEKTPKPTRPEGSYASKEKTYSSEG